MHWNYRIIKKKIKNLELYGLFEVFYDEEDNIDGTTTKPEFGWFQSVEDLLETVTMMYLDAKSIRYSVLDDKELKKEWRKRKTTNFGDLKAVVREFKNSREE